MTQNDETGEVFHRYTVLYQSHSHWSILTQRVGSVWNKVLPFCICNTFLMLLLTYLRAHYFKLTPYATAQGHRFLVLVVSYLLINRVKSNLARYNDERVRLQSMYRSMQELVQNSIIWTSHCQDASSKAWRLELTYRSLILLRCALAGVDYNSTRICAWQLPELEGFELEDVKANLYLPYDLPPTSPSSLPNNGDHHNNDNDSSYQNANNDNHLDNTTDDNAVDTSTTTIDTATTTTTPIRVNPRRWAHRRRTNFEENLRVGIRMAYLLRKTIHSQTKRLEHPFVITVENKLLSFVDAFMTGYYGIKVFLTTPVPFPWIQMSRTFTFLYVFTIPFALETDRSSLLSHLCEVFVITFGFIGLEETAKELDDPFGMEENDYDNIAVAQTVFEDVYLTLANVDGDDAADILRSKMREDKTGRETENVSQHEHDDEGSWLLNNHSIV